MPILFADLSLRLEYAMMINEAMQTAVANMRTAGMLSM